MPIRELSRTRDAVAPGYLAPAGRLPSPVGRLRELVACTRRSPAVLPVARTSPLPYAPVGCRKITAVKQPAAISARDGALSRLSPHAAFAMPPCAKRGIRRRHRHCESGIGIAVHQRGPKASPHPSPAQTFEQGQGSVLLRLRKTSMLFADGSSNASIVDAAEQPRLHATGFVRARPVASARETPAL